MLWHPASDTQSALLTPWLYHWCSLSSPVLMAVVTASSNMAEIQLVVFWGTNYLNLGADYVQKMSEHKFLDCSLWRVEMSLVWEDQESDVASHCCRQSQFLVAPPALQTAVWPPWWWRVTKRDCNQQDIIPPVWSLSSASRTLERVCCDAVRGHRWWRAVSLRCSA